MFVIAMVLALVPMACARPLGVLPAEYIPKVPVSKAVWLNGTIDTRIIEGDLAEGAVFEYTVFLRNGQNQCSGSLVAPTMVVTAAHCLAIVGNEMSSPEQVSIRVGSDWFDVTALKIHPGYTGAPAFDNDIGAVFLEFPSSGKTVAIGTQRATTAIQKVFTAGYGVMDEYGDIEEDVLRYTSMDVLDNCAETRADQFCAGGTDGYTCHGDSGGPVVVENFEDPQHPFDVLVGVTSWGPIDCTEQYSYYTSVPDHTETIKNWGDTMGVTINIYGGSNTIVVGQAVDTPTPVPTPTPTPSPPPHKPEPEPEPKPTLVDAAIEAGNAIVGGVTCFFFGC